uniref:BAG domain-containing protein n=1 Tax=Toxocara canis TaxID=6265 RepID=A0A183U943_TOXCA
LERALDKLQGKEVNGRKLKLIDDSEKRDSRSRRLRVMDMITFLFSNGSRRVPAGGALGTCCERKD